MKKTRRYGFYAGSFDPLTNGHLLLIKQAALLFDEVIVGIGINPQKTRTFDKEKMKLAMERTFQRENLTNVKVIIYNTLTGDAAISNDCIYLIRGIRDVTDYKYEEEIAKENERIFGINTIYFRPGSAGNISSSIVRNALKSNEDVSSFVPKEIFELITE